MYTLYYNLSLHSSLSLILSHSLSSLSLSLSLILFLTLTSFKNLSLWSVNVGKALIHFSGDPITWKWFCLQNLHILNQITFYRSIYIEQLNLPNSIKYIHVLYYVQGYIIFILKMYILLARGKYIYFADYMVALSNINIQKK